MEIRPIAYIHTDFPEKFGIPRQSGLVPEALGSISFTEEFRDPEAICGLEEYSHLWLIWDFSENHREKVQLTVRPPRLGGAKRIGVFASRSPFRPNPLGLSCVTLVEVRAKTENGPCLIVSGVDMLDKTPIYDIKPYLPYADAHPEAREGFTAGLQKTIERVEFENDTDRLLGEKDRLAVKQILLTDPRTAYIHDEDRIWGIRYGSCNIRFQVRGGVAFVKEVSVLTNR